MAAVSGNPAGVVIENIGGVRAFIARGNRLENRAIFSGSETIDQIDAVLQHFEHHGGNCVIEVNPANYYVDPPMSWEQRLLPHLLKRGCRIDGFRCVWVQETAAGGIGKPARAFMAAVRAFSTRSICSCGARRRFRRCFVGCDGASRGIDTREGALRRIHGRCRVQRSANVRRWAICISCVGVYRLDISWARDA